MADYNFHAKEGKLTHAKMIYFPNSQEVAHNSVLEIMDLQRSSYMRIQVGSTSSHNIPYFRYKSADKKTTPQKGQVFIDFCLPREIDALRQKSIIFKGQFGLKEASLKSSLVFNQTMMKVEKWIDKNIQMLHKRYYKSFFYRQDLLSTNKCL